MTAVTAMAQLKSFTLDDLIPGGKTYEDRLPDRLSLVWWGNKLVKAEQGRAYIYNNKKEEWQLLFDKTSAPIAHLSDKEFAQFAFPQPGKALAGWHTSKEFILYDWEKAAVIGRFSKAGGVANMDLAASSMMMAYTKDNNLYVASLINPNDVRQLTTDGSRDIVYGQSVHRNEFGINKGTFWSPDGQTLCFYRMDQTMVPDYPLVDISTRIATLVPEKYPMAGCESHQVSVCVYSLATGKTIELKTGDNKDQYYSGITWSPDSKKIFLYHLNRDQNHLRLLQWDAATGVCEKTLYEETHEKYVQPEHGLTFLPWDADKFLYWSEKDGYQRLYLYSLSAGRTLRQVTGPETGVIVELLGFHQPSYSVIVCGTGCSPIQHNLFKVDVITGKSHLLDNGKGVHHAVLSSDGTFMYDVWSSPEVPRQTDWVQTGNGQRQTLLRSADPWKDYDMPEISSGSIKAADGKTDLYYRLVKPPHMEKGKKYPAVIYVYGGPNVRMVEATYGYMYRGWELYMAQRGYVVFALDNRGSSERGLEFENVTFRHLGKEEMKDQMKGVEFLKSLPYVDASRLGVHGWSYGGFMTTNLMLTYPDVFKAGVAGGPVIDWRYYEVMYGERYMDTPQLNPEGYEENNLCLRAGNLKGRLLLIFGYNDPVCVPQHTLSFLKACVDAGTHPDLFVYPGQEHNMRGHDRIHLHEHITRYFDDWLK